MSINPTNLIDWTETKCQIPGFIDRRSTRPVLTGRQHEIIHALCGGKRVEVREPALRAFILLAHIAGPLADIERAAVGEVSGDLLRAATRARSSAFGLARDSARAISKEIGTDRPRLPIRTGPSCAARGWEARARRTAHPSMIRKTVVPATTVASVRPGFRRRDRLPRP
jgi:hypothetical protein